MADKKMVKCRIEIICDRNQYMMIDFGAFGIIIEYDCYEDGDEFYVYSGNDYHRKFMVYWTLKNAKTVYEVFISSEDYKEIREYFFKWQKVPYGKLWALLKKNFSHYVELYGN